MKTKIYSVLIAAALLAVIGAKAQVTVNISMFIQGYYLGSGTMQQVLLNEGVENDLNTTDVDTVTIELHAASAPHDLIAGGSFKGVLQINGNVSCSFASAATGSYYIVVKHRSSVETWSANPVDCSSGSASYNFSSAASQAYGNNESYVDVGLYAIYSGEVGGEICYSSNPAQDTFPYHQDGAVDIFDLLSLIGYCGGGPGSGYVNTDINGDGYSDPFDFPLIDSIARAGIGVAKPDYVPAIAPACNDTTDYEIFVVVNSGNDSSITFDVYVGLTCNSHPHDLFLFQAGIDLSNFPGGSVTGSTFTSTFSAAGRLNNNKTQFRILDVEGGGASSIPSYSFTGVCNGSPVYNPASGLKLASFSLTGGSFSSILADVTAHPSKYLSFSYRYGTANSTRTGLVLNCLTTGVKEENLKLQELTIYPNPSSDIINISLTKEIKNGDLALFNVTGAKVFSELFNGKQGTINCRLDAGIYILRLTDGNDTFIRKIIRE